MKQEILDFIKHGGNFEQTALKLWQWQVENNVEYGRFCNDIRPQRWQDIPAVPVMLFRDLQLTCFPPFFAKHLFRTSGTTGPRGSHRLQDTDAYDLGAHLAMQQFIGGVPQRGVSLVSPAGDSSLGHMCRSFAPRLLQCFLPDIGVLHAEAWTFLRAVQKPIFLPATGFAMAALIKDAVQPCILPTGSIIMITGGFKGKHTELDEHAMQQKLLHLFPTARIVGEYGMTELSSQLWSQGLGEPFHPPHWLRAMTVDPDTGSPVDGIGQLRFVDLANHQTVLAIETRDTGVVLADGSVLLHGRLAKAEPRGCSLSVEEVDQYFLQPAPSPAPSIQRVDSISWQHKETSLAVQVHRSLQKLLVIDPEPFSQGLSPQNSLQGWKQSIEKITIESLHQALQESTIRPQQISIVAAQGVFVSPLEWLALSLASGASVHVKAPKDTPKAIAFICQHFATDGFPITWGTERALPKSELIYAFGTDESIAMIRKENPSSLIRGYGHRFSIALCDDSRSAAFSVAQDIAAYDGRGCMAPVALLCTGDSQRFSLHLAEAMAEWQQRAPIGTIDPFLGPEIRRRIGLARARGSVISGEGWSILHLPAPFFIPVGLPRIAVIHSIESMDDAHQLLTPWSDQLSTLGSNINTSISPLFHRSCSLGEMQKPPFPRRHDGIPMWPTTEE